MGGAGRSLLMAVPVLAVLGADWRRGIFMGEVDGASGGSSGRIPAGVGAVDTVAGAVDESARGAACDRFC